MTNWNRLLKLLDHMFGFANRQSSKVKKVRQAFDNRTNEHVIWIEYRIRVNPEAGANQQVQQHHQRMAFLRQLLDELRSSERNPAS